MFNIINESDELRTYFGRQYGVDTSDLAGYLGFHQETELLPLCKTLNSCRQHTRETTEIPEQTFSTENCLEHDNKTWLCEYSYSLF